MTAIGEVRNTSCSVHERKVSPSVSASADSNERIDAPISKDDPGLSREAKIYAAKIVMFDQLVDELDGLNVAPNRAISALVERARALQRGELA